MRPLPGDGSRAAGAGDIYAGRVDMLKTNADDSPEVGKALGVRSIPILLA